MKVSEFKTAGKLITGLGAIKALTDEMARLSIKECAIVTDKGVSSSGLLDQLLTLLPSSPLLIIDDIPPEPEVNIIEDKLAILREKQVDGIIALGGGSAIDSAKDLQLHTIILAPSVNSSVKIRFQNGVCLLLLSLIHI